MPAGSVSCPSCGKPTPEENLRCIFCGERLATRTGTLGRLRYGPRLRWVAAILAAGLAWVLLRRVF